MDRNYYKALHRSIRRFVTKGRVSPILREASMSANVRPLARTLEIVVRERWFHTFWAIRNAIL